jgi:hypothetical protein
MGIDGDAYDAATLEVEGGNDRLPIATIELGDGIAGGGVEAKWFHGSSSFLKTLIPTAIQRVPGPVRRAMGDAADGSTSKQYKQHRDRYHASALAD